MRLTTHKPGPNDQPRNRLTIQGFGSEIISNFKYLLEQEYSLSARNRKSHYRLEDRCSDSAAGISRLLMNRLRSIMYSDFSLREIINTIQIPD
jgi:hypothetical protein